MSVEPLTTTTAEMNGTAETPMTGTTTQLDNILSSPLSMVVIVVPVVILLITLFIGFLIWWRKRKRRLAKAPGSAVAGSSALNRNAAHASVQSGPISVPNPAFSVRPQYDVAPPEQNNNSAVFRQAQQQQHQHNNNNNMQLRPMSGQFTPVALQRPLSGQMQPFNARSLAQSAPVGSSAAAPTRRGGPLKYTGLARESEAEPRYTAVGDQQPDDNDDNDVAVALAYSSGGLAPIGYSVLPPDQVAAPATVNYTSLPITQQQQNQNQRKY
jgi:hypothetical protein